MPRTSDEQDSSFALYGNYILCFIIVAFIFASDWFFSEATKKAGFLDGIIVGVFVTHALGWITQSNNYFFPASPRATKNGDSNNTKAS